MGDFARQGFVRGSSAKMRLKVLALIQSGFAEASGLRFWLNSDNISSC
jgi:hypothetical protein